MAAFEPLPDAGLIETEFFSSAPPAEGEFRLTRQDAGAMAPAVRRAQHRKIAKSRRRYGSGLLSSRLPARKGFAWHFYMKL
jgi:hypothetical protein